MSQRRSVSTPRRAAPEKARAKLRDPDATRARILEAATREFAGSGHGGARIESICRAARVNPRMIYHYFGDKDGLYVAVLERALGQLRAAELRLDLESTAPLDAVMKLFTFIDHHFGQHPELLSLLTGENLLGGRFLRRSKQTPLVASPVLQKLDQVLRRGARQGSFRSGIDPLQLYVKLVALAYFHRSNAFTLSSIFRTDLRSTRWLGRYRSESEQMLRLFLGKPGSAGQRGAGRGSKRRSGGRAR